MACHVGTGVWQSYAMVKGFDRPNCTGIAAYMAEFDGLGAWQYIQD